MRTDVFIVVTCDRCDGTTGVPLIATANGTYTDRGVTGELRLQGWTTDGSADYCEECSAERRTESEDA
jgi:hypothetical protein